MRKILAAWVGSVAALAGCSKPDTPYDRAVACFRAYDMASQMQSNGTTEYKGDGVRSSADFARFKGAVMDAAQAQGVDKATAGKAIVSAIHDNAVAYRDGSPSSNDQLILKARADRDACPRS